MAKVSLPNAIAAPYGEGERTSGGRTKGFSASALHQRSKRRGTVHEYGSGSYC